MIEIRTARNLEFRAAGEPVIEGYAAVFNRLSDDLGGFRERISPGAFARTLDEGADVRALVDHNPTMIVGRTKPDTLKLTEDATGLRVRIKPPDTTVGRNLVASIRRGDISQMSFSFMAAPGGDEWRVDDQGRTIRTLTDADLFDVSPVTFPAYSDTTVAVGRMRSIERDDTVARAKVRLMELSAGRPLDPWCVAA